MDNVVFGEEIHLYDYLKREIKKANELKFIVSFLRESGVKLLCEDLKDAINRGVKIKIITGTYLNITEPSAIYYLKNELKNNIEIRAFNETNKSFHPKTYIINQDDEGVIFIGSSNISKSALTNGLEWNYRIKKSKLEEDYIKFENRFDEIFENRSYIMNDEKLKKYALSWTKPTYSRVSSESIYEEDKEAEIPTPRGAQIEALYELKKARAEGIKKGLVIAATGVGKTFLSAFDSVDYKKILFIAHRKEILNQAKETFMSLRKDLTFGFFQGEEKSNDKDLILANIATISKDEYLNPKYFSKDYFDYIIVDEFHHAGAKTYIKVIDYFKSKFLLGITATPYRMDNKDLLSICDDNIIYQIDIKDAINRDLLVPFKYYGIYDKVDYSNIDYKNGKYDIKQLEKELSQTSRANLILNKFKDYSGKKTLGFCSSIKHSNFMARYFSKNNIKACCVHSNKSLFDEYTMDRNEAIKALEAGNIDVIFSVDIFNEGVDIKSVDTVMFLRPTESYVIFLQQLGRGLRKAEGKNYLRVLDFIGNYKKAHFIPMILKGQNPMNLRNIDYNKLNDNEEYPFSCNVNFDFRLIDLFKQMQKNNPLRMRMKEEYFNLKSKLDKKPNRLDIYEGIDIDISNYLKDSYLGFLNKIDELNPIEKKFFDSVVYDFFKELEKTSMSKSYKIPVLKSFISKDGIKNRVSLDEIGKIYMEYYLNDKRHSLDLNNKKHKDFRNWDIEKFKKEALINPIKFLSKGKYFNYDETSQEFFINEEIYPYMNKEFENHFKDIIKYKGNNYFAKRFKEEN